MLAVRTAIEGTWKDLLVIKNNASILNSIVLLAVATAVLLAVAIYCCTVCRSSILLHCCDVDSKNSDRFFIVIRDI